MELTTYTPHPLHKNPHRRPHLPKPLALSVSSTPPVIDFVPTNCLLSKWSIQSTVKLLQRVMQTSRGKSHAWTINTLNASYGLQNWFTRIISSKSTKHGAEEWKVSVCIAIILADNSSFQEEVVLIGKDCKKTKLEASRRAIRGCIYKIIEIYELTIEQRQDEERDEIFD